MSNIVDGLMRLRDRGFSPDSILDVGAYDGFFARGCRSIWPQSHILMIDALPEKAEVLAKVRDSIGNAEYVISLLGASDQDQVPFHVVSGGAADAPIKSGSSKYEEVSNAYPKQKILLDQRSLDSLVDPNDQRFAFVKLDIQGAELEVLGGAPMVRDAADVILLELSILEYNAGAPLIAQALRQMSMWGFVLYDIIEMGYYMNNLNQIDGLFVRQDSQLRYKW